MVRKVITPASSQANDSNTLLLPFQKVPTLEEQLSTAMNIVNRGNTVVAIALEDESEIILGISTKNVSILEKPDSIGYRITVLGETILITYSGSVYQAVPVIKRLEIESKDKTLWQNKDGLTVRYVVDLLVKIQKDLQPKNNTLLAVEFIVAGFDDLDLEDHSRSGVFSINNLILLDWLLRGIKKQLENHLVDNDPFEEESAVEFTLNTIASANRSVDMDTIIIQQGGILDKINFEEEFNLNLQVLERTFREEDKVENRRFKIIMTVLLLVIFGLPISIGYYALS